MNKNNFLNFIATITLLLAVGSCNNNTDTQLSAQKSDTNENSASPIAATTSKPQAYEKPVAPSPKATSTNSAKLTNEAKFLAGMKVDEKSSLATLQKTQAWKAHAAFFNNIWARLEKQQLTKLEKWTDKELKTVNQSSKVIFYPFSGPDFLYCSSFFPQGSTYVLAGLEPVGSLPALEKISTAEINRNLQGIQQSLGAILQWSFFLTNEMKGDLSQKGVLPILFVFLARTNKNILDLQYIELKKDGTVQPLDKGNKEKLIPGVKIDFVAKGETEPRSLYYFSGDLSNSGLKKTPEFKQFVQNLKEPTTYLKAASYLLQYDEFSQMRNLILSQSVGVLQDDSGVPVKYFDRSKFTLQFYGNYTQPIALFKNRYQGDLRSIYQSKNNVKPLDFGIGYRYQVNSSNLMLALRKKQPKSALVESN